MTLSSKPSWRSLYRQPAARFFLVLFTVMFVNGVVFRHGHRLADGRIISHAHPFKSQNKGPIQPNSHTSLELLLLDAVSNPVLELMDFESIDFQLVVLAEVSILVIAYQGIRLRRPFLYYSHRGPPALS
ncbi:hypothetical protein [Siphonobacter sp. SORGH_AS_0500]|uniref:hypothetical protein n=1 Tax=Siphonobacter sp. SORGH_AS_0500 TaxID=1864824 RepID=UPI0012FEB952|nr:hypothetical protein [Siphonobacter sp. SORGH_AS_0500]MDR6195025.1 hypothetical protein [Siphonobacter sp. SORGH_AS_0500]